MADNRTDMPVSGHHKKFTKRERIVLLVTLFVLAGALLYQFPYLFLIQYVNAQKIKVEAMDKEILAAAVQIADMKAREAELKEGMKNGIAGWDLVDQKGVVLVLEGISTEARRDGVNLLAVHPSQEVDKEKYKEVSMNLDLKGRYRDLAEYFKHLENLSQIVNIRKIRVEACPDASSACATQLEAVTYMAK